MVLFVPILHEKLPKLCCHCLVFMHEIVDYKKRRGEVISRDDGERWKLQDNENRLRHNKVHIITADHQKTQEDNINLTNNREEGASGM